MINNQSNMSGKTPKNLVGGKKQSVTNTQGQPQYIISHSPKSLGIGLILTLLFGPIGLFYASITGGIIMLLLVEY